MFHLLLSVIYLSFISLGLPDGLLGSAWPEMYPELGVPVSWAGIISLIIAGGTIISSLQSDRITLRFGPGIVTAASVAATALALLGFSVTHNFWLLCLMAVPYGLGAGSVDACLNNYVALHYSSRHMSWLHCMWGVGASAGPYIMGAALTGGFGWNSGYRWVGLIQIILTVLILFSLPLWQKRPDIPAETIGVIKPKPIPLKKIVALPGAKAVMIAFFCYCAAETTTGLWASSYLVLARGIDPKTAARFGSLFYLGITVGRMLSGFIANRFQDKTMIRVGQAVVLFGALCMMLPLGDKLALCGLVIIGFGCAPVYPCIIHSTPSHFGLQYAQALIGVQMASAYTGSCLMPPVYGFLSERLTPHLLPWFVCAIFIVMIFMHERLLKTVESNGQ